MASAESLQDLARNLSTSGIVPLLNIEEMNPESLRHGVTKELIKKVTSAHRNNNTYTEELRRTLQHHALVVKIDDSDNEGSGGEEAASSTTDRATDARSVHWYNVALRMTPSVQQVVRFAKWLPSFHILPPQDDQLILIKLGFYEVWLTRATQLSTPECLVFDDGTSLSVAQLEIVYDPAFTRAMLSYVRTMLTIACSEEEMAIYSGSLLLYPQRAGLSARDKINSFYRTMGDALQQSVVSSGVQDVAPRLEAFAGAAAEVRALGARHHALLGWCREHWPRLVLPDLFSEIFDIPKAEEEETGDGEHASAATTSSL